MAEAEERERLEGMNLCLKRDGDVGDNDGLGLEVDEDLGEDTNAELDIDVGGNPDTGLDGGLGKWGVDSQLLDGSRETKTGVGLDLGPNLCGDLGVDMGVDLGDDLVKVALLQNVLLKTAGADIKDDGLDLKSQVCINISNDVLGGGVDIGLCLNLSLSLSPDGGSGLCINFDLDQTTKNVGSGSKINVDIKAGLGGQVHANIGNNLELSFKDDLGRSLDIGGNSNWSSVGGAEEGGNCQDGRDEGGELHVW